LGDTLGVGREEGGAGVVECFKSGVALLVVAEAGRLLFPAVCGHFGAGAAVDFGARPPRL
jgi:hypothetical protein